jgi:hypothetical protein
VRFEFLELPGLEPVLTRPVIPVQVEDLDNALQLCLVDSGSTSNRFGRWLAEEVGIDLDTAPQTDDAIGGVFTTAYHTRCDLTIAGLRYDAPVSFCDPWPLAFNLLGQEGFLRFFRVTLCAAEDWLEVDREPMGSLRRR